MAYHRMAKQVVDFQRQSFENLCNAVTLLQDQAASTMDIMIDRNMWVTDENRQSIKEWISIFQRERNRFRSLMHEGFEHYEKYVSEGLKKTQGAVSGLEGQVKKGMQKVEKSAEMQM